MISRIAWMASSCIVDGGAIALARVASILCNALTILSSIVGAGTSRACSQNLMASLIVITFESLESTV